MKCIEQCIAYEIVGNTINGKDIIETKRTIYNTLKNVILKPVNEMKKSSKKSDNSSNRHYVSAKTFLPHKVGKVLHRSKTLHKHTDYVPFSVT